MGTAIVEDMHGHIERGTASVEDMHGHIERGTAIVEDMCGHIEVGMALVAYCAVNHQYPSHTARLVHHIGSSAS
jgi:hypothetical protein